MTRFRPLALSLALTTAAALPAMAASRPAEDVLTWSDAQARTQRLADLRYDLQFTFGADSDRYAGRTTLTFSDRGRHDDLLLDYTGDKVDSLTVNGTTVTPTANGAYLRLPGHLLRRHNTVTVTFHTRFDTGGTGILRFVDPSDRKTYIYTDFEPYGAHHLFPCFDQPDLKARFRTRVTTPPDWVVIGNVPVGGKRHEGKTLVTSLPDTPPISTYLYALHTGQYVSWHDKAGKIPLGIYARASLAPYVDTANLFTITKQGLDFYNHYFDYPYPFAKYDQVFTPEMAEEAMENPGAVTLRDDALFRHPVTDSERFNRDDTIVHEMAHMWFGDLVTMRWWNDLWLNESFATYMAAVCKASLPPRYGEAWPFFLKLNKDWAYDVDDRVTTHPIEAHIADTNAALENFDGITYGKGASVMKQLAHYLGDTAFRDGVRTYFKHHAWGTTTLTDFMAALQSQSKQDLGNWTKAWLQTAGLNAVAPTRVCQDGRLVSLTLHQSRSSGDAVQRPHRTEIGLFAPAADGKLRLQRTVPVTYTGETTTVTALQGADCPPLIVLNVDDQDYAKVRLDDTSLQTVEASLDLVEPAFARQQLWDSLWAMVRDHRLPVLRFFDLLQRHLPGEANGLIVELQLDRLASAFDDDLDAAGRRSLGPVLESFAWAQLLRQPAGSDTQLLWTNALLTISRSPGGLDRLAGLLDGRYEVPGLDLNQAMRWQIVERLTACGHATAATAFEAEKRRDRSDRGLKAIERILAARPDAATKAKAWERLLKDRTASLAQLEAVMDGFWDLDQAPLLDAYVTRFFQAVPQVFKERSAPFASSFYRRLFPPMASTAVLDGTAALLRRQDLSPELRRKVQESRQELERRLTLQAEAAKTLALQGPLGTP